MVTGREAEDGFVLSVTDFSGPAPESWPLAAGWGPVWSPDGARIVYSTGEIWTDGTSAVRLTQRAVSKKETQVQYLPSWSPDGTYIAYMHTAIAAGKHTPSVRRVPSGDGIPVNLTADLAKAGWPAWRT